MRFNHYDNIFRVCTCCTCVLSRIDAHRMLDSLCVSLCVVGSLPQQVPRRVQGQYNRSLSQGSGSPVRSPQGHIMGTPPWTPATPPAMMMAPGPGLMPAGGQVMLTPHSPGYPHSPQQQWWGRWASNTCWEHAHCRCHLELLEIMPSTRCTSSSKTSQCTLNTLVGSSSFGAMGKERVRNRVCDCSIRLDNPVWKDGWRFHNSRGSTKYMCHQ